MKNAFLKILQNSQESNCDRKATVSESVFKKLQSLQPATLWKRRLQHRCFPANLAEVFKSIYFLEHIQKAASADPLENNCSKVFVFVLNSLENYFEENQNFVESRQEVWNCTNNELRLCQLFLNNFCARLTWLFSQEKYFVKKVT